MSASDNDKALCLVAHGQFEEVEIAEMCARETATMKFVRLDLRDRYNAEIVIGHMAVAIFCGPEEQLTRIRELLKICEVK